MSGCGYGCGFVGYTVVEGLKGKCEKEENGRGIWDLRLQSPRTFNVN